MTDLSRLLADLVSGDEQRAQSAVAPLAALGEAAWPDLRGLMDSSDPDRRWWALCVLAQNERPPLDWLRGGLQDVNAEVRQCAALGLCGHPHEQAVAGLVAALGDPDGLVSHLAVAALNALGAAAVPALIEALEDDRPAVRLNATRALAGIADPRAIPGLMSALERDSALQQYWAEAGLERLGLDMLYFKPS